MYILSLLISNAFLEVEESPWPNLHESHVLDVVLIWQTKNLVLFLTVIIRIEKKSANTATRHWKSHISIKIQYSL